MKIANSIAELIGNTPIVKLNRLTGPEDAEVYAKLEYMNPGSSVKDRIALAMIEAAEEAGYLNENSTIIEPTSGNTGIGIAMVAAIKRVSCNFSYAGYYEFRTKKFITCLWRRAHFNTRIRWNECSY